MKNRLYLFLSLAFIVCLGLYIQTDASFFYVPAELWQQDHSKMDSSGLDASKPMILSTPADGSVFHGERNVTPGYGQVVSEVWTPTKPEDYYYVKIGITATGYGEVAFTLNGNTQDYDIGSWRSEPLRKANREPFTYRKKYLTNIINEDRVGFTDEIRPATVSIPANGKAQTRSRSIVTYGSRQAALNAQASATGPGVGFVIGTSTFWKWEAGITRDSKADDYDGKYHVTLNDTQLASSGSGSGSGNTMLACDVHSSGTSGDHSLQASCSSTDSTGNYCTVTSFYACDAHTHVYPTLTSTPTYHACGEHETSVSGDHSLQASCSSTDSNGNSCTVTNFYACDGHSHSYPSPPPPPTTVACGGASYTGCSGASSRKAHHVPSCSHCSNGYWTCGEYAYRHTTENTCRRPGCGVTYYECQNGACSSDSGTNLYHWAQ